MGPNATGTPTGVIYNNLDSLAPGLSGAVHNYAGMNIESRKIALAGSADAGVLILELKPPPGG